MKKTRYNKQFVSSVFMSLTFLVTSFSNAEVQGLCGSPLPAGQDQKVSNLKLSCSMTPHDLDILRTPRKIEDFKEWKAKQAEKDYVGMQEVRLKEKPYEWSKELPYNVVESWNYQVYVTSGADCGYEKKPYDIYEDIYEDVRTCVQDPEPDTSSSSGYGGVAVPSTGSSTRPSSGDGASRTYTPPANIPNRESRGSLSGGSTAPKRSNLDSYKSSSRVSSGRKPNMIGRTPQSCTWKVTGRRKTGEKRYVRTDYIDDTSRPKSCWATRSQGRVCRTQKLTYKISFAKPGPEWSPRNKETIAQGIELIPNKYDLLPGENEPMKFKIPTVNGTTISSTLSIENAWNEYSFEKNKSVACNLNGDTKLEIPITTLKRIIRKPPNSLAPVLLDKNGNETLKRMETWLGTEKDFVLGQPYEIKLVDNNHRLLETQFTANRDKVRTVVDDKSIQGNSQNMGLWKETNFKIKLFEVQLLGSDIKYVQDLTPTTEQSNLFYSGDDEIRIPLDGRFGTDKFYRNIGPINSVMVKWGMTNPEVQLAPNRNYQLKISMAQKSIPFYKSDCTKGNAEECFSNDLEINFSTDKMPSNRGIYELIRDWWRASLLQKATFQF